MEIKKILGLDLGTTSIGFAKVIEDLSYEHSEIELIGVRVNPLSTDEQKDFEKGKPVSTNADRTLKRSMRRNLDRYQQRRQHLLTVLKKHKIILDDTILAESGKNTTYQTYAYRAKAVMEQIPLEAFARVLFAINKKRGYKSSRKSKNTEEGQAIDGMAIAKKLYEQQLTPGQLCYRLLVSGKKHLPEFYRSDLNTELDKAWAFQQIFHGDILTENFKQHLKNKGQRATAAAFWGHYGFNTAENKGTREEKKLKAYKWRNDALSMQLTKEEVAYVITEINNDINKSSGYLGAISDRSKELYFKQQTVGQYQYEQLATDPHKRIKGQTFYRQDYLDEFEKIWEKQASFYPQLTVELKEEIRDIIIFYQRKLKSQKGLVSFCEFENREITIIKDGKPHVKKVGSRVIPKSSPLFQEFKIWQILNNLQLRNKITKEVLVLSQEAKEKIFEELNIKGNIPANQAIKIIGYHPKEWETNYSILEGNRTNKVLYEAFLKILEFEGHDFQDFQLTDPDTLDIAGISINALKIKELITSFFDSIGINTHILDFEAELDEKSFEQQPSLQLWHLLYSIDSDDKKYNSEDVFVYGTENIGLKKKLCEKFGFKPEHTKILTEVIFDKDYGNLSRKAIRNIFPYIRELTYDKACQHAGYRHSAASLTKEEIANRPLQQRLSVLKKNELRNPVVEKILNQMINLVNSLIDQENEKRKANGLTQDFHFDEIRIELARELKKNATERAEISLNINSAKLQHEKITTLLKKEFGLPNPSRKDIIRYKLYEELKNNGYKDLYTNTYIPRELLFTKDVDIDHIIPQMIVFDDSFSNKTIIYRQTNIEKGNRTAYDFIDSKYGIDSANEFLARINHLFELGKKNKEEGISKAKFQKLQKRQTDLGDGFIERDLRESQYIAKKAKEILLQITRRVVSTSGEITARLRKDWNLVNIMQELNLPKYKAVGLTESIQTKEGNIKERIIDWSKRDDHRHHAMDALTIAFTRHSHIQYLNYLNARKDVNHKLHNHIIGIENKETVLFIDDLGNKKRRFKEPIDNFRELAKGHLQQILVSYKTKNKVFTRNKNVTLTQKGTQSKTELTPRGQLHKETIYGKYRYYESKEEKVSGKFDEATIQMVCNPLYRTALLNRLRANDNDPKKAFTGKNAPAKNPIYIDHESQLAMPEKIKLVWLEEDYSIKKDVTPDNFKDEKAIEKVVDSEIKKILINRLVTHGNDAKRAFSDLDNNPIWFNKEKGIAIKGVTISAIKNAESLHFKKDHLGNFILDDKGNQIPSDFVSTGNNHHVAIYLDADGNLQDKIVTFFEAVQLGNAGEPIIDKTYNQGLGWRFLFTMKQNEMFVFPNYENGFDPKNIDLLDPNNRTIISPNLFRVQTISVVKYGNNTIRDFKFRHHLETSVEDKKALQSITYRRIQNLNPISSIVKVRINHTGLIIGAGEF